MNKLYPRAVLAASVALALTACGGGGGAVRSDPPPTGPTTPPTTPTTCQDHAATNYGGPLPCTYPPPRYSGVGDNALVPINADQAHTAGFTGTGVKVGVLDDRQYTYPTVDSKVVYSHDFTGHAGDVDNSPKSGHGDVIAALIAGTASSSFKGGVAPSASLYWGTVCFNDSCDPTATRSAIVDLNGRGVRLFNASFNHYNGASNDADAQSWATYFGPTILANDSLIVFATGNEGASNAGYTALAPKFDASLAHNWLAVSAVDVDSSGHASTLSSYANACGDAAQWCLVAPGTVQVPGIPGTKFAGSGGSVGGQGTSFATALVTGSAALVWQAFPWMSASNVQQTLLTTATDMGAAGVDNIYGWGLVNAAKAVQGPGQFVGTFNANVGSGSYTFANPISGTGDLVKTGNGTLILSGANTYSSGTTVQGGTLMLTGSLGSSVAVANGGTFGAMGGTINGNYSTDSGSTTALQIGNGLTVTGTASLDGTLKLLAEASGYSVKPTETLLTAGSVTGTFDSLTYGSGVFWSAVLGYTPTSVTAAMTRTSTAQTLQAQGASLQAVQGGAMADSFLAAVDAHTLAGTATTQEQVMASRLASAPTASLAATSLASLTGSVHGMARTTAVQQGLNASALLADRTRSLGRFGDSGVWVQLTNGSGKVERTGYNAGRYGTTGGMIGVDWNVGEGATVGLALGGNRDHANLDGLDGRLDASGTTVAAYGRVNVGQRGYLSGSVSHQSNRVDDHRSVLVGTTLEGVDGHHTDTTTQARIEGGIAFDNGLTPYAAIGSLRQRQGGFAETGGAGFGLLASGDTLNLTFAELGLRFDVASGQWVFGGDLSARSLLNSPDTGFDAAFTGAPGTVFAVVGPDVGRSSARLAGHAFYRTRDGWIVYFTGGVESGASQHGNGFVAAGVKWGF